jgi:hypothetical protein
VTQEKSCGRNNGRSVGGGDFFAVRAEGMWLEAVENASNCNIGASQRGPEPWHTEAEDIVRIRCQATPSEDIEGGSGGRGM